jgi:hypothetical protein
MDPTAGDCREVIGLRLATCAKKGRKSIDFRPVFFSNCCGQLLLQPVFAGISKVSEHGIEIRDWHKIAAGIC